MNDKKFAARNTLSIFEEVDDQLEKLLSMRKEEIEKGFHTKIQQEREDAERKVSQITQEFTKGRGMLAEYKAVLMEFENERVRLENEIRVHFSKAVSFQTEIERMAGLTQEELRKVNELNQKLESLNLAADERTAMMRKDLEEKFGIITQAPEVREPEDFKVDLNQELIKLKKIKDLLESEGLRPRESEAPPEDVPAAVLEEPPPLKVPEINETGKRIASSEEPSSNSSEYSFKALFEKIEPFRRTSSEAGNGSITYFRNERASILDGERFISSVTDIVEETKKLFQKLSLADTPKSVFFIKQDIINHQETLRKFIQQVVRMCEKEGVNLPRFSADILNLQVLKNLLERLCVGNWSNEGDFTSFSAFVEFLRNAYYERITPPAVYLKSVIDELGIS